MKPSYKCEISEGKDKEVTFEFEGYLIHGITKFEVDGLEISVDTIIRYISEGWLVFIDLKKVVRCDSIFTGLINRKFEDYGVDDNTNVKFIVDKETDVYRALIDKGVLEEEE